MADEDRYLTGSGEFDPERGSGSYNTNTAIGPFSGGAILSGQEDATPIVGGRFTTQLPEGLSATLSRTGQAGAPMERARDAIRIARQLEAGQLALEAARVGERGLPSYGLQYSGQIGKQGGAKPYYPPATGNWYVDAGGTPGTPERHIMFGAKGRFADGGEVDAALHTVRQHFDEGGFLDSLRSLFSGDDYQSTGDKVIKDGEVQWGNPESAADFFRADKARMALDKRPAVGRPEDDVTGSVPMPRPRPAPEAPAVKIPFEARKAGVELPEQAKPEGAATFPYTGFRAVPPGFAMPSPVAPDLPAPRAAPDVRPMAYAPATGAAQAPAFQAINAATSPLDIRDISHLAQYRGSAMENPQAVVFHHTAGEGTPEGVVNTLNNRTDPFTGRPMVLGTHYIIDRDGSIHAALPPGTRGAHIMPSKINDLTNANTYGVEVIAKDNSDVTPAQIAAGQRLYAHLSAGRSEPLGVFGHGELNPGHKLPDEGLAIVNPIRTAAAPVSATDAAVDTTRKVTNRAVNYPELSADDKDLIAKTIAAEASGKSPEEAHAIANVILNRAIAGGRYGKSIRDILFAENQFEPWSDENKANYPMKFKPGMPAYDAGAAALQKAYDAGDITGGSTYFWAPGAQGRLGRDVPGFARKYPGFNIGATRFHRETREAGGEVEGYGEGGQIVKHALDAIRGWHGSGKQFKQFDASKMGSGAGELFGRGVYITDTPNFARTYRNMALKGSPEPKIGGVPVSDLYMQFERQAKELPPQDAKRIYDKMQVLEDMVGDPSDSLALREILKSSNYQPEAREWFESKVVPKLKTPGGLYEVEIKAKPEQFLQWQKPFGEQSPFIQDALRPKAVEMAERANQARAQMLERGVDYARRPFTPERIEELRKISTPEDIGGLNLYGGIHRDYGSVNPNEWQPEANQFLRDQGVVGNTYRDMAGKGKVQNYVVYDPADTEILNRYAHGGEIHGDGNMGHNDIVSHALHALRRHFDGSDGSYVDPMGSIAIPAAGPAPEQAPVVMENAERARAAEERARLAADIKAYEASNARIQEQPEWTRAMTHGPEEPRAPVTIDAFGRERVLGHAPYKTAAPLSSLAQFGYGLKTAPLYAAGMAFPPAAALGTAIDTAEGFASGSPTQVAMGAIGGPFKTARNVFGPLAVASGLTAPDEAEAARVPKIGGALSGAARAELSRVAPKAVDPSLEKAFDIVRSATADDAGQAVKTAKQVAGPPQRGILATPDLRQIDRDEAIRVARSEPHLIQDANGQYVGAPRGMTTPEQIQAMREAFDKDVEAGAVGGDWYERAREFNREVSGNDPYRQKLIANEEALWSAQANPDTNLGFGLNARTDYEAGKYGDKYRTGQQARSYEEARRAMDLARSVEAERGMMGHNQGPALTDIEVEPSGLSRLGKKTGIYGQHLDPTVAPATTGTNDIWHARGFGYTNQDGTLFSRALTPQEHRFLDYETMLAVDRANAANLAGRSDWTGAEIQAAPWVAGKGRALAQRGNKPLEQGIAEAAQTYPDVAPKYTYSTPIEQIPGANTGLLPNLINADDATKAAFTARANWKDPNGRDALWSELGMPTRYTNDTLGAYRNSAGNVEFNPLEIGRPMSGFGLNEAGNPVANPRMAAGLSMGQAARGLLDFQEGTPWNKFITHGAGPDKTSIHVGIGRNPTREELDALMQLGQKHGLDLTNTEGGVGFINFKDNQTTTSVGKDLKAGLLKEIKSILPDATVQRARFQGDYFDLAESGVNQLAKENQGKGLATKKLFDNLSDLRDTAPDFYKRILDSESISAKARANLDRLMESGGKGQRPDYERLLKIVGEDGLRGLLDRVTKLGYRGLPAIGGVGTAGAVLNSSASKDGSEPGRYD